jgi:hypothetical protein
MTTNIPRCDQRADVNDEQLVKYAQVYELPEYVLDTPLDSMKQAPEKNPGWYADTRGDFQFPCHTKAACVVSNMFFLENQGEINAKVRPMIADRLAKFASHWQVTNLCNAMKTKHAQLNAEGTAWPDSSFALVQYVDSRKTRQYPLRTTLEIKEAATWFGDNVPGLRAEFEFKDRQTIATKILEKAAELGAKIPDQQETLLQKFAGHGLNAPDIIAGGLEKRAALIGGAAGEMLYKLAETVRNKPKAFLDPATTTELGTTLDQLDREHGLITKYADYLLSPEDLIFGITYKEANAAVADACQTLTGSIYSKSDFEKLALEHVIEAFGEEIARSVSRGLRVDPIKMAEFASTAPLGDARALDDLLSSIGINPLAKEASQYGLTPDEYAAIMTADDER